VKAYRNLDGSFSRPLGRIRIVREDREDREELTMSRIRLLAPAVVAAFRSRLRGWVLPALAAWARTNGEAFARAVAHPDSGVTVRIVLTAVPGLDAIGRSIIAGTALTPAAIGSLVAKPTIEITVQPGRRRRR
jgi:hypothetical protein